MHREDREHKFQNPKLILYFLFFLKESKKIRIMLPKLTELNYTTGK